MNMALQAKEYQELKRQVELLDTFLQSLECTHKRDIEAYLMKKTKWLQERGEIVKKMEGMGI